MTGVDVEHTKALEAAATPAPWFWDDDNWLDAASSAPYVIEPDDESAVRGPQKLIVRPADAEFIAHARTAVPALIAAVERVQALHTPDEFGMCEGCAPSAQEAAAKRAAERARDRAVEAIDQQAVPPPLPAVTCPSCGVQTQGGKFCQDCGAALGHRACATCGAPLTPTAKFCGDCGAKA